MLTISKLSCLKRILMQRSKSPYLFKEFSFSRNLCVKHSEKQDILNVHSHSFGYQSVSPKEKREKGLNFKMLLLETMLKFLINVSPDAADVVEFHNL